MKRECKYCKKSIDEKRKHATYCNRTCKGNYHLTNKRREKSLQDKIEYNQKIVEDCKQLKELLK